jgi:hypothetical protein
MTAAATGEARELRCPQQPRAVYADRVRCAGRGAGAGEDLLDGAAECLSNAIYRRAHSLGLKLMLPNAHHAPAPLSQCAPLPTVTLAIPRHLRVPIRSIRLRPTIAPLASVPEAPINEYSQFGPAECKIGPTKEIRSMQSVAAKPASPQNSAQPHFGRRIPARYTPHRKGTHFRGYTIHLRASEVCAPCL